MMRIAQQSFALWGGEATVAVTHPEHLAAARMAVDRVIAAVDQACSSYRDDSDLARVNDRAGRPVAVGGMFLDVLRAALRAAELTGGLVDPTGAHPHPDNLHDPEHGALQGRVRPDTAAVGGADAPPDNLHDPVRGARPGVVRSARRPAQPGAAAVAGSAPDNLHDLDRARSGTGRAGSRPDGPRDLPRGLPGAVRSEWRSIRVDVAGAAPRPDGFRELRRALPGAVGGVLRPARAGAHPYPGDRPRAVPGPPRLDWRSIRVDLAAGTVCIPVELSLDFGAVGKAFAADRAAAEAAAVTGCGVLVALGGDIAMVGRVPAGGWRVRVADDHRRGAGGALPPGQDIVLHAPGGLATSSLAVRIRRMPDGRTVNHIVDPRTGMPVRGPWRTVSVSAATCVDANTASTAALVDGHGAGGRLAADGLPARLVHADGWVHTVAGWPTDHSERPGVKVAG
jgi:thiamine biosynthesis lipoprotein ApbE